MSNNLFNYFKHESSLPYPSGPLSKTVPSAMIQAANIVYYPLFQLQKEARKEVPRNVVMVRNVALTVSCCLKIKRFPSKRRTCT